MPIERLVVAVALLALLAGCESIYGERYMLSKDWLSRQTAAALHPVYCYRTLVDYACYDTPRADSARAPVTTYLETRP